MFLNTTRKELPKQVPFGSPLHSQVLSMGTNDVHVPVWGLFRMLPEWKDLVRAWWGDIHTGIE